MNKSSDLLLRKLLKRWAGKQSPPANARARLLWDAAHQKQGKSRYFFRLPRLQFYYPPALQSEEWPQTLSFWVNEHALHAGLQVRLT